MNELVVRSNQPGGRNEFMFVMKNWKREASHKGDRETSTKQTRIEDKQKDLENRLVSRGYHVERGLSVDQDEIFLTFGLSDELLEEFAERIEYEMELKVQIFCVCVEACLCVFVL